MKKLYQLKRKCIMLLVLLHAGSIICGHAQNGWIQMTSMNVAKGGSGSCVIDSMIYIFGGSNYSPVSLNSSDLYNTKTDVWSEIAPVPLDLSYTSVGVINNKIYLAGGWRDIGPKWVTIDSTFAYDPITDTWETKKPCPTKIGDNASCVLNDKLYLLGGLKDYPYNDTSGQKQALAYDPATDTWDTLPNMLYRRGNGARACVYDGKIHVFGGLASISGNEGSIIGKAERYDPGENAWTELADMPVQVAYHITSVYNDKIYVFGGDSSIHFSPSPGESYCTNIIQEYDPVTDEWRLMEPIPFNRSDMAGLKAGNFVYIIGGYPHSSRDFPSVLSEVWRFNLDSLQEWKNIPCSNVQIFGNSTDLHVNDTDTISVLVLPYYMDNKSVSWSSSDETVATVTPDGVVTAKSKGPAIITATAVAGGCTDSYDLHITYPAGIENSEPDLFKIYPNPAKDQLTVKLSEDKKIQKLKILSIDGKIVRIMDNIHQNSITLNLDNLPSGLYFLRIHSDEIYTAKVLVE